MTTGPCPPGSLRERCVAIEILVMDVDGVLTDGSIIYGSDGVEIKAFHVRDGSGLKIWKQVGKRSAILTGRTSKTVTIRAAELDIDLVIQGAQDKLAAFWGLLKDLGLEPGQVCFVGDDLPDLAVMRQSGLAVAVADACAEVREAAQHVTRAAGGRGAVRETIELLLHSQGHWPRLLAGFRQPGEKNESAGPARPLA